MKYKVLFITLLMSFLITPAFAINGEEALARFKSRMLGIEKMTGNISWSTSGSNVTGNFKYMNPGKIYVKFSSPSNKVVVANGRKLWVYDPGSSICGIQDLAGNGSGGIASLVNDYLAIVTAQGSGGYTLKLKNNNKTYSEITLILDSSFMLKKAVLKSKDGENMTFTLSNVDTSASVMKNLFDYSVPSNSQVVKNPMNIK
jgi:outer membrane lipoprotein-sorting protein